MKAKFIILTALLFLFGCSRGWDYKDYFNFYNQFEEPSYVEIESNGFIYQLQYRPKEFLAINELKTDPAINNKLIESELTKYDEGLNYCLRISSTENVDVLTQNLPNDGEYYTRIGKLNVDFPYLISGINDADTIRCQFHHFERAYKIQPFIQVLFSLNATDENRPNTIQFEDIIFNDGRLIEFKNLENYYTQLPELNL
ncbi:MAG: hypothetical protein COA58_04230 [Bacteroidetes bacterium]|nr:MAG: hypothetical protein COA58_04230 [Bacteroidota bacterium]